LACLYTCGKYLEKSGNLTRTGPCCVRLMSVMPIIVLDKDLEIKACVQNGRTYSHFGDRCFMVAGPKLCNRHPVRLRQLTLVLSSLSGYVRVWTWKRFPIANWIVLLVIFVNTQPIVIRLCVDICDHIPQRPSASDCYVNS